MAQSFFQRAHSNHAGTTYYLTNHLSPGTHSWVGMKLKIISSSSFLFVMWVRGIKPGDLLLPFPFLSLDLSDRYEALCHLPLWAGGRFFLHESPWVGGWSSPLINLRGEF